MQAGICEDCDRGNISAEVKATRLATQAAHTGQNPLRESFWEFKLFIKTVTERDSPGLLIFRNRSYITL